MSDRTTLILICLAAPLSGVIDLARFGQVYWSESSYLLGACLLAAGVCAWRSTWLWWRLRQNSR
jgi:hypothetical protein